MSATPRPPVAAPPPGAPETEAGVIGPLLRGMQVIALLCLGFAGLLAASSTGPWSGASDAVVVAYLCCAVLLGAVWTLRGRARSPRPRRLLAAAAVVTAVPPAILGSVGFTIPALLLVVALTVVDLGWAAGIAAIALMTVPALALHVVGGSGWLAGLVNSVPVAVLLGFGLLLGATLRAYRTHLDQRIAALAAARESADRLRRAAAQQKELVLAQERARAARDLHDGLGHRLTLISLGLEFAERMRDRDPDAAWAEVSAARGTSQEALTEMRTWVRALSPVRDSEATGSAAIEAIAESFRGTGLEVTVRTDPAAEPLLRQLGEEGALLLYRAVQEGLTSALRHGRARRMAIDIDAVPARQSSSARAVDLVLRNDLDPAARDRIPEGPAARGFGLRALAERAEAQGGALEAARAEGEFALRVRIPAQVALATASEPAMMPA